jgi:hypothetical protein
MAKIGWKEESRKGNRQSRKGKERGGREGKGWLQVGGAGMFIPVRENGEQGVG